MDPLSRLYTFQVVKVVTEHDGLVHYYEQNRESTQGYSRVFEVKSMIKTFQSGQ